MIGGAGGRDEGGKIHFNIAMVNALCYASRAAEVLKIE